MAVDLELYLEAERRGILPQEKKKILDELRSRGVVGSIEQPQENNTGFKPIRVPTLAEKSVEGIKKLSQFPTRLPSKVSDIENIPPFSLKPIQKLQDLGEQVTTEVRSLGEKFVSSPNVLSQIPTTKAVIGTLFDTLVEVLPLTPQEMSIAVGSEIFPKALSKANKLKTLQRKVANEFLDTDVKILQKERRTGVKTLADKFQEKIRSGKLKGSRSEIADQADEIVKEYEHAVQNKISKITKEENAAKFNVITRDKISRAFDEAKEDLIAGLDNKVEKQINRLKKEFMNDSRLYGDLSYWNNIKRKLYRQIGDKNYIKDTASHVINTKKNIARVIKEEIEKIIPDIKELNLRQGEYLVIRDSLNMILAKTEKKGIQEALKSFVKERAKSN